MDFLGQSSTRIETQPFLHSRTNGQMNSPLKDIWAQQPLYDVNELNIFKKQSVSTSEITSTFKKQQRYTNLVIIYKKYGIYVKEIVWWWLRSSIIIEDEKQFYEISKQISFYEG